jgi:hypothetical protein
MTFPRRLRALYGAGPLHLLALAASFAIAGAAVVGWFQRPRDVVNVLEWFVAAIVIHDLVLFPLYSLLDRIAFGGVRRLADHRRQSARSSIVNATPYLRVPAILSALLFAAFFPVILGLGEQTEFAASGIAESGYLARWLLATGVIFAASAVAYAVAVARAGAPPKSHDPDPEPKTPSADAASAPQPDRTPPSDNLAPEPDPTSPSDNVAPAPEALPTPSSDDPVPTPPPEPKPR